jgi:hypothetical protein
MRDDLLDAQAAIEWADSQIPLFQQGFIDWLRANPYSVVEEPQGVAQRAPVGVGQLLVFGDRPILSPE